MPGVWSSEHIMVRVRICSLLPPRQCQSSDNWHALPSQSSFNSSENLSVASVRITPTSSTKIVPMSSLRVEVNVKLEKLKLRLQFYPVKVLNEVNKVQCAVQRQSQSKSQRNTVNCITSQDMRHLDTSDAQYMISPTLTLHKAPSQHF